VVTTDSSLQTLGLSYYKDASTYTSLLLILSQLVSELFSSC
jgi:hypothetical protein